VSFVSLVDAAAKRRRLKIENDLIVAHFAATDQPASRSCTANDGLFGIDYGFNNTATAAFVQKSVNPQCVLPNAECRLTGRRSPIVAFGNGRASGTRKENRFY